MIGEKSERPLLGKVAGLCVLTPTVVELPKVMFSASFTKIRAEGFLL
jgi:hypothetical protein